MARTRVALTDTWQQVGVGPAIITVKEFPTAGAVFFNEEADDLTATGVVPSGCGAQVQQTEEKAIYAKGEGFEIIVDEQG